MKSRPIVIALAAASLAVLGACGQGAEETPYQTDLNMKELMGHVVDPAAWQFWNYTGWIDDASGTTSRAPTTEEGWLDAETGAVTVAEAANLLMLPGRRQEGRWMEYAQALYDAGMEARQATIDQDEQAMFDTGGKIYEVCTACHEVYLLPNLPPEERDATFAPLPGEAPKDKRAAIAGQESQEKK